MNEATLAAVISTAISGIGVFISYLVARQQTQVLRQSANQEKNHFIWQNRQEIIQPALNIVAPIFAVATLDLPASASDALANSWENYFRGFLMSPFKIRSWDTFYIIVNEYLQTLKRFKAGKITREVASKARYSSYNINSASVPVVCGSAWATNGTAWWTGYACVAAAGRHTEQAAHLLGPRWWQNVG